MILVRDIFQLKFGKAKQAKEIGKEFSAMLNKYGYGPGRLLTDLTGPYYTFIMETTFESMADYEKALVETQSTQDFSEIYQRFVPLIESGSREIFTIVE